MFSTGEATLSPNANQLEHDGDHPLTAEKRAGRQLLDGLWRHSKRPWYTEAVRWAASEGIVGGYGGGLFGTNDPVTREQLAVILYRYAAYKGYDVTASTDLSGFNDMSEISDYALEAMQWANAAGIVNSTSDTTLDPKGSATRAQMAAMLQRFCETIAE